MKLFSSRDEHRLSVAEITRLYAFNKDDLPGMGRATEVKALPHGWRDYFRVRLETAAGSQCRMCYNGR
jgi:3-alpha domain